MGKIRTETIKRIAHDVRDKYPNKFTTDFEKNKLLLDEIAIIPSKTLRNRIAGYITRRRVVEREDVKPVDIEEESLTE
ncbi:MAG: 30S ribosomal protein S17e [Promethearchaeota archaeon]|nr:MAG: 30S ribosomal protein S17e [Candidatus Lokiarchaeota archaeon]